LRGKRYGIRRRKNVRDWLYVIDHRRAIEAVLAKGKVGETYCVGGMTRDVSNLEVIKMIPKNGKKMSHILSREGSS
jgi:dTDP-D-glucose 4,6-dehydratase